LLRLRDEAFQSVEKCGRVEGELSARDLQVFRRLYEGAVDFQACLFNLCQRFLLLCSRGLNFAFFQIPKWQRNRHAQAVDLLVLRIFDLRTDCEIRPTSESSRAQGETRCFSLYPERP